MSIETYLKQIARGARGARDLERGPAHDLFAQVLERRASDLEIGAFCVAMRIKGESAQELAGFYDAIKARLATLCVSRPVILLPSYNGARKTPLMTPLLARLLADKGYAVLVHGLHEEARRTGSEQVFTAMGWPVAQDVRSVETCLEGSGSAYCSLDVLSPELAWLLWVRRTLGLRNSGHVLAKLINPVQTRSLQIVNYTHPEYPDVLAGFFALHPASAVFMRGHEGEPVPGPRRLPEIAGQVEGVAIRTEAQFFDTPTVEGEADIDVGATVALYRRVISGAEAAPPELAAWTDLIERIFPISPAV
ncbi:MAG: DNA-binding protein YbiB [Burkholderiaceae bacterium]|nr:DNA-binding protein YbiB [Burkholderiaceae bacterium]